MSKSVVTRKLIHDWDAWLKEDNFIVKYKDFSCKPESIPQQIRNAATDRKLRVSIINHESKKQYTVTVTRPKKKGGK